jgi:carbonic anhydrase
MTASRRRFISTTATGALAGLGAMALSSCASATGGGAANPTSSSRAANAGLAPAADSQTVVPLVANADDALRLLSEGNQRFVDNRAEHVDDNLSRRIAVRATQLPFATILSCIDSRVPVELIFDRGLGDLVVIRSAGEVLDRSVTASLEYGVADLNTPLLMVLGHQRCGAVTAAVKAFDTKGPEEGDIGYLVDALAPAVQQVSGQPGDRVTNAVRANVALTLAQLRKSPVLSQFENQGKAKLVGGYYSLDTGKVDII